MAQTIWKGHLAFGLVTIPVRLTAAARSEAISSHMLHRNCGGRIEQKLACKRCGQPVTRDETLKGYEETTDTSIAIEPSEIEAIAPASSTTMEILQFVQAAEVDPIYFDSSYYLDPDKVGCPAYKLLTEAMRSTGRVAVAKLAMHQREHTVVIRPHGPGLTLHAMFYETEVRAHDLNLAEVEISSEHLKLAEQLIATLAKQFDPRAFRDEYQARLLELIESKRRGQPLTAAQRPAAAPVIDMVDALVRSLERTLPKAETTAVPVEPSQRRRRAAK